MFPRLVLGSLNSSQQLFSGVDNDRAAASSQFHVVNPPRNVRCPLLHLTTAAFFSSEIAEVELHTNCTVIHPRT